jgi:hypothetical protein
MHLREIFIFLKSQTKFIQIKNEDIQGVFNCFTARTNHQHPNQSLKKNKNPK